MSIEKIECVMLLCDNCGNHFEDWNGFSIWPEESTPKDMAMENDWHTDGNTHYCNNCYTINGDDEIVVDKTRKNLFNNH